MPHPTEAIVIFAKAPQPGKVKTRLIGSLPAYEAANLHDNCIEDMLHTLSWMQGLHRELHVAGPKRTIHILLRDTGYTRKWKLETQRGRDLGARMRRAFQQQFSRGMTRVVIVGTDTPWMGSARVAKAFALLKSADAVLGPCGDGGYYLIGLRRMIPEIFRGISWGSANVFRQTVTALKRCKASYRLLPLDFDLDRPADLRRAMRLRKRIAKNAFIVGGWLQAWHEFQQSSRVRGK